MAASALLLAVCAGALLTAPAFGAVVSIISPSQGSMVGGTKVTVHGAGFARGPMGSVSTARVFVGALECRIEPYYSSDSRLVCYTPASPSGVDGEYAPVVVQVLSIDMTGGGVARCATGGSRPCTFQYRADRTPRIDAIYGGGVPGSTVRFTGWSGVSAPAAVEITMGATGGRLQTQCGVTAEAQLTADDQIYASRAWNCTAGGGVAGYVNVTFRADDASSGYGGARVTRRAVRVLPDDRGVAYTYAVVPSVDSVSYAVAGTLGGDELVIGGSGFDPEGSVVVTAAGVPCDVTRVTRDEVRCVPGPAPAVGGTPLAPALPGVFYPGGRGMVRRTFLNGQFPNFRAQPTTVGVETQLVTGVAAVGGSRLDNYAQELRGFFVPLVTANYSFYLRGDDYITVYLSVNASEAGERRVAWTEYWCVDFFCNPSTQLGRPVPLVAGVPYWLRVTHSEGVGDDWFDFGVRVHADSNVTGVATLQSSVQARAASVPAAVALRIATPMTRSSYEFNVTGANSGEVSVTLGGAVIATVETSAVRSWDGVRANVGVPLATALGVPLSSLNFAYGTRRAANATTSYFWTVTVSYPLITRMPWPAVGVTPLSLVPQLNTTAATARVRQVSTATQPLEGYFRVRYNGVTASALLSLPTLGVGTAPSTSLLRSALQTLPGLTNIEMEMLSTYITCVYGAGAVAAAWVTLRGGIVSPGRPVQLHMCCFRSPTRVQL